MAPHADADVAVVVAARNAVDTIGAALASVAAQVLQPAEVVVTDDASSDGTADVARRWQALLPVRIVRSDDNVGPGAAFRLAVAASSSPLVATIGADDIWLPDHLSLLVADHRTHRGIATANALWWHPGSGVSRRDFRRRRPLPTPAAQPLAILRTNFVFSHSLFERELYNAVGGFRPEFRYGEDWDLWIRMIRAGARVTGPDEPSVLYRQWPKSLTSSESALDETDRLLRHIANELTAPHEQAVLNYVLRDVGARRQLASAYALARADHGAEARRAARRALAGSTAVRARAVLLLISPGLGTALRDRVGRRPPTDARTTL